MSLSVDICHRFDGFTLNAAFQAPAGVTALFGRSGAGKTTLVNAVAGLLRPDAGRITLKGRVLLDRNAGICLPPHQRRLGYVFQDARLFPHLSVAGNLDYGTRYAPAGGTAMSRNDVIDLLGLAPLLDRRPRHLSGGETQRVAIGRALLSRPEMLLMDEPLAALDASRKADILPYLERLKTAYHLPILYVSHALDEIARLADTLVLLSDGAVHAAGPIRALLSDPALVPLLGVREAGAVIDATVTHHADDGLTTLRIAAGVIYLPGVQAHVGDSIRVRIRAGDVIVARARPTGLSSVNILPVTVTAVQMGDGPGAAIALDAAGDALLARITARSARDLGLHVGMNCFAVLKATSVAQSSIGHHLP